MHNHPLLDPRALEAVVQAGAYAEPPPPDAAPMRHPELLLADIQAARVDLYCDHNDRAVAEIRSARRHLEEADPQIRRTLLESLDRAAWLTRHHDFEAAEQALERAAEVLRATLPH